MTETPSATSRSLPSEIANRVIAESHARLDAANVPSALGGWCTDPTCQTRLGHRIKLLVADRDALRVLLRLAVQQMCLSIQLLDQTYDPEIVSTIHTTLAAQGLDTQELLAQAARLLEDAAQ